MTHATLSKNQSINQSIWDRLLWSERASWSNSSQSAYCIC